MPYANILTETHDTVRLIVLNRPKALNALSGALMDELTHALDEFERDDRVRAAVLTGSEKAFAAGADIVEMKDQTFSQAYAKDFVTANWERVATCRKPVIAAVAGYALGGGCELAMMCDFIIAAENAKFGQPEVTIGASPGVGGSQRLTRIVGKSKAMDMILTGRMMDAEEAERSGLASRVVPTAELVSDTIAIAKQIAALEQFSVMLAKESVDRAYETTLAEGIRFERRLFQAVFGTAGQREGMNAFVEKRPAQFNKT